MWQAKYNKFILFAMSFTLFVTIIIAATVRLTIRTTPTTIDERAFPEFEGSSLSDDVKALLSLAKAEYENPQPGTFYANGVQEPWCADFVSYLYKEAGHPFQNPNNGNWRIPGIYTLKEYFRSIGAWHPEPDYLPKPGDVAIYDGGFFGGHTNLVVEVGEDYMITLGGNEDNAIFLGKFNWRDSKYGLQGFGHLLD